MSSPAKETIHDKVDQMPVFLGKEAALNAYFQKALADKIYFKGGTVTLRLVIDKAGQPKGIEVHSGLGNETDALVLEAARKMPKWQPGKQKGQPVNVRIIIPVVVSPRTQVALSESVENKVYSYVEQEPSFKGGQKALQEFLENNIRYPAKAKADKTEGRVVLSFIVNTVGIIHDPVIMRSILPEIDMEAIRLIKSMPPWIPGKHDGKNLNVRVTFPIYFRLKKPAGTK